MDAGPVGIITGGLKGIGAATAMEFARTGARMVLTDLSQAGADDLMVRVRAAGGEAVCISADVRDPGSHEPAVLEAVQRWGRIDFLVANAGIADQSRVATGDPDRWRAVVETNLLGVIYVTHVVLPTMLEQGSGHVIITCSVSGREAYVGEPVYIASKWGQVGFAHSLRLELIESGVRVTLVEPGLVNTPLTYNNPKIRPLLEEIEPLSAEDVARAVVFAYQQPPRVSISEIVVRPQQQLLPRL
ncbi:MAG TPA: SDR family oxidoreductase [Acidimicrobiales bacterium]|nr:SDR family oxidoreductase [Acidimicrobiales bacterium]